MSTSIPDKMKCILIKDGKGPAENLYMGEEKIPSLEAGQVLVKVRVSCSRWRWAYMILLSLPSSG
jgi:hypothetical protein